MGEKVIAEYNLKKWDRFLAEDLIFAEDEQESYIGNLDFEMYYILIDKFLDLGFDIPNKW